MANTQPQGTPVRQGRTSPHSVASLEQELVINTLHAQNAMRRSFERLAGALFRMDVLTRIALDVDDADRADAAFSSMFSTVEDQLEAALQEYQGIMAKYGIDTLAHYDRPSTERVRITSPQVGRFVRMIRQLDKVVMHIDTLWLSGLVSNKDRSDAVYRWQQKVVGFATRSIGLEKAARTAAQKAGKDEQLAELDLQEEAARSGKPASSLSDNDGAKAEAKKSTGKAKEKAKSDQDEKEDKAENADTSAA